MDIDTIATDLYTEGLKHAEIKTYGHDKAGRLIQTTYWIEYYPESFEKLYRYSISSRVIDPNWDGVN
jgi:hypothetical protein